MLLHTVSAVQTRLLVAVGAVDSYSVLLQTVSAVQVPLLARYWVAEQAASGNTKASGVTAASCPASTTRPPSVEPPSPPPTGPVSSVVVVVGQPTMMELQSTTSTSAVCRDWNDEAKKCIVCVTRSGG